MEFDKALGMAIRDVRISLGFSQEYFSDISSRTYVSVLENGRKQAKISKINELSNAMGVHPLTVLTLAYLLADDKNTISDIHQRVAKELSTLISN